MQAWKDLLHPRGFLRLTEASLRLAGQPRRGCPYANF
jgi:hypothetical protein